MQSISFNLLDEINSISKIHTLKRKDIDAIMVEFAQRLTATFHIEKLSVWLFNDDKNAIISMGEYDLPSKKFTKDNIIYGKDCPNYFRGISENEILLAPNVFLNEYTKDLVDVYFNKHNIISLMDIPLRIEGELVGIMCFEKTGTLERYFSEKEQLFALSVALVFASNLEARQRRAVQSTLDKELQEKDILIKEINHRVKNNISVVASLVNLQKHKAKDKYHKLLFEEIKSKVDAISSIHEITYKSNSYSRIEIQDYLDHIVNELISFYKNSVNNIEIVKNLKKVIIDIDKAIPLALIINEVITNAFKHAFEDINNGRIEISFREIGGMNELIISDNGKGFDYETISKDSLGIDIINGLVEQIGGKMSYKCDKGTKFMLTF